MIASTSTFPSELALLSGTSDALSPHTAAGPRWNGTTFRGTSGDTEESAGSSRRGGATIRTTHFGDRESRGTEVDELRHSAKRAVEELRKGHGVELRLENPSMECRPWSNTEQNAVPEHREILHGPSSEAGEMRAPALIEAWATRDRARIS